MLELIDPEDLPTPESYTHVVSATGSRLVFVAGQVAEDADGNLVGAVVGHRPQYLSDISAARIAVFGDHRPADTVLGVQTLAEPGRLIEVEAIAVLD